MKIKKKLLIILLSILSINFISCRHTLKYTDAQLDKIIDYKVDSLNQEFRILKIQDSLRWCLSTDSIRIENEYYKKIINDTGIIIDSLNTELLNSNYKLERINYYNSIATGTNLKYLRGWINRVLKD